MGGLEMLRNGRRLLGTLVAFLIILSGAAAFAATVASSPAPSARSAARPADRSWLITAAAEYLGMTTAQLRTQLASGKTLSDVANATSGKSAAGLSGALSSALQTKLAAAVAAGKISTAAEQKIEAAFAKRLPTLLNRTWDRAAVERAWVLKTSAEYLGMTTAQLRTQLASGKTLSDVANATSGKSASGLASALSTAMQTRLGKAVAAGQISTATEQKIEAAFAKRLPVLMNRTWDSATRERTWVLKSSAEYLGMTPAALRAQLASGKTLSDVANATTGKSASGLASALSTAMQTRLGKAVAAGKISTATEQKIEAAFAKRLPVLMNRTWAQGVHARVSASSSVAWQG